MNKFCCKVHIRKICIQTHVYRLVKNMQAFTQTPASLLITTSIPRLSLQGIKDEAAINHRFRTDTCEPTHRGDHPHLNLIMVVYEIHAVCQQNTDTDISDVHCKNILYLDD